MNSTDFTTGMTVYSADGSVLGEIEEVWANTASHGLLPMSRHLVQDYGPIKGTAGLLTTPNGSLHIRRGALLGFGGTQVSVPFSAVSHIDSSGAANLKYTASGYEARFNENANLLQAAA